VNTTTVTAHDEFRTTAEEMYQTFTDPQRLAAFTRAPPRLFEGAQEGGKFSIFDGNVTGEFVKLEPPTKIIQKWRLAQWPEGHTSLQEIVFDQNNVDRVTNMRVTWTGVPVGQEEVVQRNWEGYYVRSIKQTFGYAPLYRLTLVDLLTGRTQIRNHSLDRLRSSRKQCIFLRGMGCQRPRAPWHCYYHRGLGESRHND